ncbi:efflux RND transporter periplasmic adaptor subunit [bacterium]|nr:efflux RND transporter periplasmic adaptor subunit [bacterium]
MGFRWQGAIAPCLAATLMAAAALATGPAVFAQRPGQGPIDVFAAEIVDRPFVMRVEALGNLEPKERVDLSVNAADRITQVYFEDGQRVKAGATLLTMARDEERAQLEALLADEAEAVRQLARNQRLAKEGAVSASELERSNRNADASAAQVRALQARLRDRVLTAPFSGVLGFRRVSPGAFVSPGQVVATLIDDSSMRLEFSVPSVFISDLRPGLEILARSSDLGDRSFTGTVTSIDNAIDPVTRSVRVRATLPNKDGVLRAGMFMTVDLRARPRNSLAVPEGAIIAEGPNTFVFRIEPSEGPSVVAKTQVKLGTRDKGVIEVLSGLNRGDMVVSEGVLKLRPGAAVRVRESGDLSPPVRGEPRVAAKSAADGAAAGVRR